MAEGFSVELGEMSDQITWTDSTRRLGDLIPQEDNPREIERDQAKRLVKSWHKFGQPDVISIGPDNRIYNGHQRYHVWGAAYGMDCEVAVRVSSRELTRREWQELTVLMHEGATGRWDWDLLAGWDGADVEDLTEWGFDLETLLGAGFDADEGNDEPPPLAQMDKADELQEKWQVKTGDLWEIGRHRLICGDCTDEAVVARVMGGELAQLVVTDPPYGVEYADKNKFLNAISPGNRIQTQIAGDHGTKEDIQVTWKAAFCEMEKIMLPGAVVYCFMPQGGDQMMMMMMMMMTGAGIEPRHELIWLKNNHVLGRVDYAYKHEPILYAWKAGGHKFYGDFQTSILEFPKPQKSDLHPTTKPTELIMRLIENSSQRDGLVYDLFLGSGTTLVACEQLNRRGHGVEIEPRYCSVTLERLSEMGLTPVKVQDASTLNQGADTR